MNTIFYDIYLLVVEDDVKAEYRKAFRNIATAKLVWDKLRELAKESDEALYDKFAISNICSAMLSLGFKGFMEF